MHDSQKCLDQFDTDFVLQTFQFTSQTETLIVGQGFEKLREQISPLAKGITVVTDQSEICEAKSKFDIVLTNSIFEGLSDEKAVGLFENMLTLLKPDGRLLFRENCFRQDARNLVHYDALLNTAVEKCGEEEFGFDVEIARSNSPYKADEASPLNMCWTVKKVLLQKGHHKGHKTLHKFLDSCQYSKQSIVAYEKIFGEDFISVGGLESTERLIPRLQLEKNSLVLDVGCGIGGSAFYIAREYGATVQGLDLSANMVNTAFERLLEKHKDRRVSFEISDATCRQFPQGHFDVIYSRDTILHIENKQHLFNQFHDWLKPGGRLLITDYCCSPKPHSEEYQAYLVQRGYHKITVEEYSDLLKKAGFALVDGKNYSDEFLEYLRKELQRTQDNYDELVAQLSKKEVDDLMQSWKSKIGRVTSGEQQWGYFYAEKAK